MSLENMQSKYGNIVKKGFKSQLEAMGKDKTTPAKEDVYASPNTLEALGKSKTTVNKEDVFASPVKLEQLGKTKFVTPDKYDPNK